MNGTPGKNRTYAHGLGKGFNRITHALLPLIKPVKCILLPIEQLVFKLGFFY